MPVRSTRNEKSMSSASLPCRKRKKAMLNQVLLVDSSGRFKFNSKFHPSTCLGAHGIYSEAMIENAF